MRPVLTAGWLLLATAGFAQSPPMSAPEAPADTNPSVGSMAAADFVRKVAVSDQLEIASSRIAMERGSPDQQAFAKQMIESHEKIVADLKRLVSVEKIPVELPVEFDKADETRLDKLKSVEAAKFIAEYTTLQVTKHRNALALFERYAKDGDNMNLKAWARRMLPAIRHDLAAAEKLPRS